MSQNFLEFAYFEGGFISFTEAKISIATHAFQYATSAWGGMRAIPNPSDPTEILLFRLDRHTTRLSSSAKFLQHQISASEIENKIVEFIKINKPSCPIYVRPMVYNSGLGIAPRIHDIEKDFLIYGLEMGDYLSSDGISCRFSSWYRQEDRTLPLRAKVAAAYLTSAMAKTEAVESGFDEAILLNSRGKVSEASAMNIFVVRNGELITPGVNQDILEGITRDSVIVLAEEMGIKVTQREVDKTELYIADEVFLTGTAAKIAPVNRVENILLPKEKPITQKLLQKLTAITLKQDEAYSKWITVIKI